MNAGKKSRCLLALAAAGSFFASSSTWADMMDCSGTKRSKERPYQEVIEPGDRPDHAMKQAIRTHAISSKNPDFDGSEQTVYAHEDNYANAGTSVGYFMYTLKNGEKIWAKFDSVFFTASTQGSWEATYQGVFRLTAGTGKYSGIRGGGSYKGKITPAGFDETFVCTAWY
ncbi:MAG TPA: hypothetical protein VMH26_21360 [Burkholderiales bacterium]|nr:hypothetical protein [Burkholderiales bacterium]